MLAGERRVEGDVETDPVIRPTSRWARWVPGGVVVSIALGLQALWLRPPFGYDPTSYLVAALRLGETQAQHRTLRIGLLLPFRLALELFGETQMAFYFVGFLAVALLAGSTYWLGSMLFTGWIGAVAAAVTVFNPVVMTWSSQPYPDLLAAALFTLGLAVFAYAAGRNTPTDRIGIALAIGAGLLFGWSYLTRELMVFLFPVVLVAARMWRVRPRLLALVAVGALAMLIAEWTWGVFAHDDPFIRWRVLLSSQEQEQSAAIAAGVEAMRGQGVVQRAGTFVSILARAGGGPLWLILLGLALLSPLLSPGRGTRLALWWFGVWYVFLTVANFLEVLRTSDLVRYWYPIFPALALAGVAGLFGLVARLVRARWESWAPPVAVLALLVLAAGITWVDLSERPAFTRNGATSYEEFRDWLRTLPPEADTIWSDEKTATALRLYTSSFFGTSGYFDGEIRAINAAEHFLDEGGIDEGYVVFQDEFFQPRLAPWANEVPDYLSDPPQEWVTVAATSHNDLVMFRVSDQPNETTLFDVGQGARFGWRQLQPVVDVSGDPDPGSRFVTVPASSRVVVGDDTSRGMGARPRTATVRPEELVRFQVTLDVDPTTEGSVEFLCVIWDDEGRTTSLAATGWRPDLGRPTAEFFCDVPHQMIGDVTMRGAVRLTGPIDVRLDTMIAAVSNG